MSTSTLRSYRLIPSGHGACTVCDEVHPLTQRHKQPPVRNRYGTRKRSLLPIHGPRNNRCPGGHTEPAPWLESSGLPDWEAMSDLDRGAAFMWLHKRRREGAAYAMEHYPVRYVDHPVLVALEVGEACAHATTVAMDAYDQVTDAAGWDEYHRLYELALNRSA